MAVVRALLCSLFTLNVAFATDMVAIKAFDTGASTMEEREIEELKSTTFDELLVVLHRVQGDAEKLSFNEALERFSTKVPEDIMETLKPKAAMLQSGFMAAPPSTANSSTEIVSSQAQVEGAPIPSPFGKGTKLEKAMRFLNKEFQEIREQMDVKLFECGFYKVEKEGALDLIQADIERLAEEIGMLEKDIAYAKLMIEAEQRELERLQGELKDHLASCEETREALIEERDMVQSDLDVATIILDVADKECQKATMLIEIKSCAGEDGRATFTTSNAAMQSAIDKLRTPEAKAAAERMLFEASQLDADDVPGDAPAMLQETADGFPAHDPKSAVPEYFYRPPKDRDEDDKMGHGAKLVSVKRRVASKPAPVAKGPGKAANDFCVAGVKPDCAEMMDKLGNMKGEIQDTLDAKIKELNDHNLQCDETEKAYRKDIQICNEQISTYNVQLMEATAQKQAKQAQGIQRETERHELCEAMREKYLECHDAIRKLEGNLCGIFKVRQSTYQQMKGESPDIQDCLVGPWVPGECTKSCVGADGIAGVQVMHRKIIAVKNLFGASCPPVTLSRECEQKPCPVPCKMGDWAGWSKCTKDCGGGSKSRNREIVHPADFGGTPCSETQESVACNTESCDKDCVLHDWTSWTPCTKSCKADAYAEPGKQYRRKHIKEAIVAKGTCAKPDQRERYEWRSCNTFVCPSDGDCVAAMDMVIMLDGSGSLWAWGPRKYRNRNFLKEKEFTKQIINHATMDGHDLMEQDDEGKYPVHMRIGVVLFSGRVVKVHALTGQKAPLLAAVDKLVWPKGWTNTHVAIKEAMSMLQYTRQNRIKTIMTITDGRPTNRGATYRMAQEAIDKGIRLVTIPVGRAIKDKDVCKLSSSPCIDNVEKARKWADLIKDLSRFVAVSCPVIMQHEA